MKAPCFARLRREPLAAALSLALLLTAAGSGPAEGQGFTRVLTGDWVADAGGSRSVNWIDADADGDLDLYVTRGGSFGEDNLYFRNDEGDFVRVTDVAIADDSHRAVGASWGDHDNDGDPELLVVSWYNEFNDFFDNNGDGTFTRPSESILNTVRTFSEDVVWVDVDADGDLDAFVANSGNASAQDNLFYLNESGSFVEQASSPLSNDGRYARCPAWGDYDDDGDLDLFVANELDQDNRLYRNELVETGSATFVEVVDAGSLTSDGGASFGASWADIDNDGDLDLFVVNSSGQPDFLYRNELAETGTATFTRVLDEAPAQDTDWGVSCAFGDVDNDGDLDLFVTNGFSSGSVIPRNNALYENDGQGSFTAMTSDPTVTDTGWSYGAAFADPDGDGDLDLYVAKWMSNNEQNAYYRNEAQALGRHWLTLELEGTSSNRSAIGARVTVVTSSGGEPLRQVRWVAGHDGYGSQNLRQHFGLLSAGLVDSLIVDWPSGVQQVMTDVAADQHMKIVETGTVSVPGSETFDDGDRSARIVPNPFRSGTRIVLAADSQVRRVDVLDVSGRHVRTLIVPSASTSSGVGPVREVYWDGRTDQGQAASPGIFFARFHPSNGEAGRRMLLLR